MRIRQFPAGNPSAEGHVSFGVESDAADPFKIDSDGKLWWGNGSVYDVSMERTAPGALRINGDLEVTGTGAGTLTPEQFGAVGDGVADDTAELVAMFAAVDGPETPVVFTRGKVYRVTGNVQVLTGTRISGYGSEIKITGIDGSLVWPAHDVGEPGIFNALLVPSDVEIRGLTIRGENSPYVFYEAHQSRAIQLDLNATDVLIEDCTFVALFGHSMQAPGGGARVHVRRCTFIDVNHTVNHNGDHGSVTDCLFKRSAVVESSSSNAVIARNVVYDCPSTNTVFSIGGRVGGTPGYGGIVAENTIVDCAGRGIVLSDGTDGYVVALNTVIRSARSGFLSAYQTNTIDRSSLIGNVFVDCGLAAGAIEDRTGISVLNAAGLYMAHNTVANGDSALHTTAYGISVVGVNDLTIIGNKVSGTATKDIELDACLLAVVAGNDWDRTKVSVINGTTFGQINHQSGLSFSPDATADIGSDSGYRPRDVYIGRDVFCGRNFNVVNTGLFKFGDYQIYAVDAALFGRLGFTGGAVFGGDLDAAVAGKGLKVKEGANARMGVATLVAGTVTVANTSVTASTRIFLTVQSLGTVAAPKAIAVTARVNGTSFTITSEDGTDTSVVAWHLIEPST